MANEANLLETTLKTYLQDPTLATKAEINFKASIPVKQQTDLDAVLTGKGGVSYRDGALIQLAYAISATGRLDTKVRPEGARTVAKALGTFLKKSHVKAVADAYQNIAKNTDNLVRGNVGEFDDFLTWAATASKADLDICFQYACSRVAATARPVAEMPDLNLTKLTFAAVMGLYEEMLAVPSQGAHEQFIIGSLLDALMQEAKEGYRVETKKLNASDRSSKTAGDIQVFYGTKLVEAYELTANDWRTKLEDAAHKVREHDLKRVHIVAPLGAMDYKAVAEEVGKIQADLSVIDLRSFAASMLSVLSRTYRAVALQQLYNFLDRYQEDTDRLNNYVELLEERGLAQVEA